MSFCNPTDCSPSGSSAHGILQDNTGVGCHILLQGIFPTQGSNPSLLSLLHWQTGSLPNKQSHINKWKDLLSWRCHCSPNWSVDSVQSQTKFPVTFFIGKEFSFLVISPVSSWLIHMEKQTKTGSHRPNMGPSALHNNNDKYDEILKSQQVHNNTCSYHNRPIMVISLKCIEMLDHYVV